MASWVLEFQRQEYSSNLYKNNQNFNPSKSEKSSPSLNGQMKIDQQNVQLQISNQPPQQVNYHAANNDSSIVQRNQYKDSLGQSKYFNKRDGSVLVQKHLSEEHNFLKNEFQQNYDNNNNLQINKTQKRSYSSSPAPSSNRTNFNEEAELVGQLINIRKVLPRSINEQRLENNNQMNNDLKNTLQKNSLSSISLQSMEMDELNPEMIDKLLNNYNFDSFQN